jgi:N6-adenosine-specific RNA methylase IME4
MPGSWAGSAITMPVPDPPGELETHPLANIFPLLEGAAFEELVADIKTHGLREEIVLVGRQILDGRHRYRASIAANVEPRFKQYTGNDPVAFVISANLRRRHLSESQRAMVAAKLATLRLGANQHSEGPSIEGASKLLNIGHASVERARKVLDHGAAELQHAVQTGHVSVTAAADVASRPIAEQAEIIARGPREILRQARLIREQQAKERLNQIRERAKALTEPGGFFGGTIADLDRLSASGRRFGAIVADPPWPHANWTHVGLAGDRWQKRRGERSYIPHYRTMTLEEICALPVEVVAAADCVLFLWVVQAQLPQAHEVLRRWGFEFKTVAFAWFKGKAEEAAEDIRVSIGTGYWTRAGFEQCWLATRGNPRRLYADGRLVIIEPRREHSRKPDCVHDRIERLVAGPYLELFARRERAGWTTWGNEIPPPSEPNEGLDDFTRSLPREPQPPAAEPDGNDDPLAIRDFLLRRAPP